MRRRTISLRRGVAIAWIASASTLAVTTGWAFAPFRPPYIQAWISAYPNSTSSDNVVLGTGQVCQLCHEALNGGDGWNGYGWSLREFMETGSTIDEALLLVESLDSDADPSGSTDFEEIEANTQPGWTDGPNNTIYYSDGSTSPNQLPPAGILGTLDPLPGVGTAYCFGDGSGSPCGCGNTSMLGAGEGCANSSSFGGVLFAGGSASVAADDLECDAIQLLPNQPALLFVGNVAVNGGAGVTFGDGLRCAGAGVVRLGVRTPNGFGEASWGPGLGAIGGWSAGNTRYLQVWYRDPGGPCVSNFNLTNGLEVNFVN